MSTWDHKDEWRQRGKDFLVAVSRHSVGSSTHEPHQGPHRWTVYAYLYPTHRLFGEFSGTDMWQRAATDMPMHGGPSLLRWHRDDDGKPTSVQVGADYNHLYDDHFCNYETAEDAQEVFADAQRLVDYLTRP